MTEKELDGLIVDSLLEAFEEWRAFFNNFITAKELNCLAGYYEDE